MRALIAVLLFTAACNGSVDKGGVGGGQVSTGGGTSIGTGGGTATGGRSASSGGGGSVSTGGGAATNGGGSATNGGGATVYDAGTPTLTFVPPAGVDAGTPITFDSIALRGYGVVAGEAWVLNAGAASGSVLIIRTADAAHASLLIAKYESDLKSLGDVTATQIDSQPAWQVAGQGNVITLSSGPTVAIIAATTTAFATTLHQALSGSQGRTYGSTATVPMFLDRWDKYAFNFYHYPAMAYGEADPAADFDYAQSHGGTGFVINDSPFMMGDGLMDSSWSLWALDAARAPRPRHHSQHEQRQLRPDAFDSRDRFSGHGPAAATRLGLLRQPVRSSGRLQPRVHDSVGWRNRRRHLARHRSAGHSSLRLEPQRHRASSSHTPRWCSTAWACSACTGPKATPSFRRS